MKKTNYSFIVFSLLIATFLVQGCEIICSKGTLKIENTSLHTVQRIYIDDVNFGSIDPTDFMEIPLSEGKYKVELKGIHGGDGCSPGIVTITNCETKSISCSR